MRIDHVTLAGSSLGAMQDALARLGLATEYGGAHSNGVTHMAQRTFDDDSYLELISRVPDAVGDAWWTSQIADNAGPCAWAIVSDDLVAERDRLAMRGIPADGPHRMSRHRPDGTTVEWELFFPGSEPPGATLPFVIRDITPRATRVRPAPDGSKGLFTGVDTVVIAVRDLDEVVARFRRAYDWPMPVVTDDATLEATRATFPDSRVTLVNPHNSATPLGQRIERYGNAPCAFLIGSQNAGALGKSLGLEWSEWNGRKVLWLEQAGMPGVGIVEER
jgi:hypothetical protein